MDSICLYSVCVYVYRKNVFVEILLNLYKSFYF